MKSLANAQAFIEILARLSKVQSNSPRQWGRMTPHQMLCHLSDSYLIALGEREAARRDNLFTRKVLKWIALDTSLSWPKGIKTSPTADQEVNGTPPVEFEHDREALSQLLDRFVRAPRDCQFAPHPIFGEMTEAEWLRWGYLHADHHFRQFGI